MQELVDLEIVLVSLSDKIRETKLTKPIFEKCILKRLNRKANELVEKQFRKMDLYLYTTNDNYRNIADENLELLKSDQIDFIVYENSYPFWKGEVKRLEGNIHANGFSYSDSVFYGFSLYYPTGYIFELRGKIDYWGNLNLKPTKTKFDFFKKVPKQFRGEIDSKGIVNIQCIEKELDIFNKTATIGKIISNHFGDNEIKNQRFQTNKQKLKDMIEEFRLTIKEKGGVK